MKFEMLSTVLIIVLLGSELLNFCPLIPSQSVAADVGSQNITDKNEEVSALATNSLGFTNGGPNIVTYVDTVTEFRGRAVNSDGSIIKYEWDFEGDDKIDFVSSQSGIISHIFSKPGKYIAKFKASDMTGKQFSLSEIKVIVRKGYGEPLYLNEEVVSYLSSTEGIKGGNNNVSEQSKLSSEEIDFLGIDKDLFIKNAVSSFATSPSAVLVSDGIKKNYVVMINAGNEPRFWEDVTYAYDMFHKNYLIPDSDIYLLNDWGLDSYGNNPDNMIDYSASKENIAKVFDDLARGVDSDDSLYIWITGHGFGYTGSVQRNSTQYDSFGYLDGRVSVDSDDEQDYKESDFKLRALYTGGDYNFEDSNHGMEIWKTYYSYLPSNNVSYYRHKFVSHFNNIDFLQNGVVSDSDIFIEELTDYLVGDYNKDGIIDESIGETIDYNKNGVMPYNYKTKTYDEGDWGRIDTYEDNVKYINTQVPAEFADSYRILDIGLDNHLDIDLDFNPLNLQANGTDLDNNGLFDGLDVNDDGDKNDWVSIDEAVSLRGADLYDDDLKVYIKSINAGNIVVAMQPCHSGGFIEDLSQKNLVIMTSTEEETVAWGNRFIRNFTSALSGLKYSDSEGNPSMVDVNSDFHKDMTEVFNFIASNGYGTNWEIPQYDDNGDKVSHTFPIPSGSDGSLGKTIFLTWPMSVKINNGAEFTNSKSVMLNLSVGSDVLRQMQFSNDGVLYSSLEPYKTTKNWTISSGDGVKKIYVKFVDATGKISQTDYSSIILDTTPPIVYAPQTISPTNNSKPVWSWPKASDSGSGSTGKYKFYLGTTPGGSQIINGEIINVNSYVHVKNLSSGQYYAYITTEDLAGNSQSSSISSVIINPVAAKELIKSFSVSYEKGDWKAIGIIQKDPNSVVTIWASLDGGALKKIGNEIATDGSFYFTPSKYWKLSSGKHTIKIEARPTLADPTSPNTAEASFTVGGTTTSPLSEDVLIKDFYVTYTNGVWKASGHIQKSAKNVVTIWASLDGGALKKIGNEIATDGSFYFTPSKYWKLSSGKHTIKIEARPTLADPTSPNTAKADFVR